VYLGDDAPPFTAYDYTPSRRRKGAMPFLNDFTGTSASPRYLQADACGRYDGMYRTESVQDTDDVTVPIEVPCWAHARRAAQVSRLVMHSRGEGGKALLGLSRSVDRSDRTDRTDLRSPTSILFPPRLIGEVLEVIEQILSLAGG